MCKADNVGPKASETDAASAGNLSNKLALVIGVRFMLLNNVWTEVGHVNGAQRRLWDCRQYRMGPDYRPSQWCAPLRRHDQVRHS